MAGEGPAQRPTGTVTFLFTDVVGSTRLWGLDESAMSASLHVHDLIVRAAIESRGGYVFSTAGDSFSAAFARASAAIEAATDLQTQLGAVEWPGPVLDVRAAVHIGEAEERDGDYFGPVVNVTSRIEHAARGGQIVLTEAVRVASGVSGTTDLGLHRLRDVDELVHLHQIGDTRFPPLDTGSSGPARHTTTLPAAWLVVRQPGHPPERVTLTGELAIGRDVGRPPVAGHFATRGDPTVSRLHAVLTPRPTGWSVQATSATNGLHLNGRRVAEGSVHLLEPDDELRLGERTLITFHTVDEFADRSATETARPIPELSVDERELLVALCSPVLAGDAFTPPASVAAIGAALDLSDDTVRRRLGCLADKFAIEDGPDRRQRLANEVLACGAVRVADLGPRPG